MDKPILCTILGVEPMEEFQRADPDLFYRIEGDGHVYQKDAEGAWAYMGHQFSLEEMIQYGVNKTPRLTDKQRDELTALKNIFCIRTVYKNSKGIYIMVGNPEEVRVYIPAGSCLTSLFDESHSGCIDIYEVLKRRN